MFEIFLCGSPSEAYACGFKSEVEAFAWFKQEEPDARQLGAGITFSVNGESRIGAVIVPSDR